MVLSIPTSRPTLRCSLLWPPRFAGGRGQPPGLPLQRPGLALLLASVRDDGDRYLGCHGNRSVERSPVLVDADKLLRLLLRQAVEVKAEADVGKVGEVIGVSRSLNGDLGPLQREAVLRGAALD